MKIPLPERMTRLAQWFRRENDRPLLGFFIGSQYPLHRYYGAKSLPSGLIRPEDVIVQEYLDDFDRLYDLHENAGGDLIWSAAPFWGIPWVEAALGCKVIADHTSGSTRTEPPPRFAEDHSIRRFSADDPWGKKLLEFISALEMRSSGRYPVGVTLMRGISDLLSALYGAERLIYAMYEEPQQVCTVADSLTDFWIAFGQCLLEHLPLFHGGSGTFFYSMWFADKTIWTQEDAAALLSPELYERFIHPCVSRIAEAFDNTVIHLHPSKFVPLNYLLESPIAAIELHIDKGGPTAEQLYETHMTILSRKPLLIYGDLNKNDLEFVLRNLPCRGLAVNMVVPSVSQAQSVWETAAGIRSNR